MKAATRRKLAEVARQKAQMPFHVLIEDVSLRRKNSIFLDFQNDADVVISGIVERPMDEYMRAYIRIPDGYRYAG